jgi:DNA-binding GntR family transcriptional regulator
MLAYHRARDLLNDFKHNQQIHSSIIALSGNDSLVLVQGILQAQMKRIRFLGNRSDESWAGAVADHEEMIAALEARDGERLGRALAEHLARTWDRVQHAL